ncbi:MAG: HEAT repeat domain-containing protein, partial [Planctomycetota bacterium]
MSLVTLACSMLLHALPPGSPGLLQGKPALEAVLAEWHSRYRSGRLDLSAEARNGGRDARFYGVGHLPPFMPAYLTHEEALALLLEAAVKSESVPICRQVLALAAVGAGKDRFPPARRSQRVRSLCQDALQRFNEPGSLDLMHRIALGEKAGWKARDWDPAIQVAAIRALGRIGQPAFRPSLEKQLQSEALSIRIAAGEALGDMNSGKFLPALTRALNNAENSRLCRALISSGTEIIGSHQENLRSADIRYFMDAAISRLGRTDWRADLAVVNLMEKYRSLISIIPLIEVLERFIETDKNSDRGKLSGILQNKAHAVLGSLTGAIIPMDRPDKWREFWEREKADFTLSPVPERIPSERQTTAGFFGIPVQGSNLVYIIDTSGSMGDQFNSLRRTTDGRRRRSQTRLRTAKKELLESVAALPESTSINVVFFSDQVSRWRRRLVSADRSNRSALSERLKKLGSDGGTNIYG